MLLYNMQGMKLCSSFTGSS